MGKAYTSLAALVADIQQEIGVLSHKIARGVAEVAYFDMQEAHGAIMESYYGGYTPVDSYTYYNYVNGVFYSGRTHGYRRTGNLRSNSIIPQGVTGHGHTFTATVQIGSDNMDEYINSTGRKFPAEGVFGLVWNKGVRGLPEGWRGHIGSVNISASPVGVSISGTPDEAMRMFMDNWWSQRGEKLVDTIAGV